MLDTMFDMVYLDVAAGNKVSWHGFGQFSMTRRAARIGVNPRNPSEKITIPELQTPKFKAGEAFKKAIELKK